MLQVNRLTKSFGGLVAVNDLGLHVEEGEILGLIGPNGSGKTTSFNLISGFMKPDRGSVRFGEREMTGLKPHKVCQAGIARTFQLTRPFAGMTAIQNVLIGRMYGRDPIRSIHEAEEECLTLLQFVGLGGRAEAPVSNFGVVDRKRLEVARALATRPRLLLLDEMMSGLNPAEMEEAIHLVRAIAQKGITLMVVEHVMKAIIDLCERLIVLNYGRKIAEGAPREVLAHPAVVEAYLGE
ncbi:MAG: ABC transporter ATP-binding protein [Deltaproteobacteria bacterium]|nr:ABC transporter ATP-binding protein [Deltaproteobacteria bacterium]